MQGNSMTENVNKEKNLLDQFFADLQTTAKSYCYWVKQVPENLYINPEILAKLSKIEGFYQRPELQVQVSAHAPIVRYINLKDVGVVFIVEDYSEKFFHFR